MVVDCRVVVSATPLLELLALVGASHSPSSEAYFSLLFRVPRSQLFSDSFEVFLEKVLVVGLCLFHRVVDFYLNSILIAFFFFLALILFTMEDLEIGELALLLSL